MDLERLIRLDPRGLFSLVLMDMLAPRGSMSPLTPLWKVRRLQFLRSPARRPRPRPDEETGKRHG